MINRRLAVLVLLSLTLSLVQCYYNIFLSTYFNLGYPHNTSLFNPAERFHDFYAGLNYGYLIRAGGNPYTNPDLLARRYPVDPRTLPPEFPRNLFVFCQAYFPLDNALVTAFAGLAPARAIDLYLACIALGYAALLAFQARTTTSRPRAFLLVATPLFFLSYPFIFALDRGNFESLVALLAWLFVLLYRSGSPLSWLPLSVAGAIKPHVGLLAGLALLRLDWRFLAKWAASSALLFILPLAVLPGTLLQTLKGLAAAVDFANRLQIYGLFSVRFNHTLFNLVKGLMLETHRSFSAPRLLAGTECLAAAICALTFARLWKTRRSLPFEYQLLALTIPMIALTPYSYDYALLNLFPVFFLLIGDSLSASSLGAKRTVVLALLTVALAPKEYGAGLVGLGFGAGYILGALSLLCLLPAALLVIE